MAKVDLKDKLAMTSEQVNPCECKISFTVTADAIAAETAAVSRMFAGSVVVPGFRKGKAPESIIRSKYLNEIKEELRKHIVSAAAQKAFDGRDRERIITVIDTTAMDKNAAPLNLDSDYQFVLTIHATPSITLPEYKGLTVELPELTATDEEINARLERLRDTGSRYAEVEGAAQAEDMVKISYTSDFEVAENASPAVKRLANAETSWIWLKSPPVIIPGAVEALTGATKDQELTLAATFPADWKENEFAGRTVNYKIKVLDIQRQAKADDEEICKHFKVANLEELRAKLKEMLIKEKEQYRNEEIFDALFKQISEKVGIFHLPEIMVNRATANVMRKIINERVKTEEDAKEVEKDIENIQKNALHVANELVRHNIIIGEIALAEKLSVSRSEMESQLQMMAKMYRQNYKEMLKGMSDEDFADIEKYVLSTKVKDLLVKAATVNIKG